MRFRAISKLIALLAPAIVLGGCVLSIDPIVTDAGASFDPSLLGTWEEAAGSDRAVISRSAGNTYAIEYTSDGKVARLEARLGRLAERQVLDVWAAPGDSDLPQLYGGFLTPGHLLLCLDIGQDEIRVTSLEDDPLLEAMRTSRVRLEHTSLRDRLILHGNTDKLRSALGPYIGRSGSLARPDVWRRADIRGTDRRLRPVEVPCFEASAWREADRLFHRDPHWMGADCASSVDLGKGRTLWLFSDTWIDPSGLGTRQDARMVSNSVALQAGSDPATAEISFHWGKAADGSPAAFFPDRGGERLWFGSGVRVADQLVLFLGRIRNTHSGLGFESAGWTAFLVENPDSAPPSWRVRSLETAPNPLGVAVGFAAALSFGEHVYAFGSLDPVKSHPIYAARWPAGEVRRGNLANPEWWAGERLGWIPDSSGAPRWPIFENGQSELSIHRDPSTERFIAVHTLGFGPADVMMRAAPALTGPWSAPRMAYRPAEYYRPNVMIYAAKAHPQLTGGDLVLTYATNTFRFAEHLTDSLIYYPRFMRLTRCR